MERTPSNITAMKAAWHEKLTATHGVVGGFIGVGRYYQRIAPDKPDLSELSPEDLQYQYCTIIVCHYYMHLLI
jgi:hypothetical protein